ncbi:reverse transcriptase domain-containing protein [Tanacetum coccineum]
MVFFVEVEEPDGTIQLLPIPSKKDTQTDEKGMGKGEPLEKSLEDKPPEKVVIHDDYPDQTIIIGGNLSAECRSGLVVILQHELNTYPHIELRVQRKRSIAPDRRKVVKDEVAEWLKARIVRKNAEATYQRLVDTIFEGKMGRNLEAYVDDMVIKKAEEAFQAMKKLIAELPALTAPKKEEELMVYLSAANEAISVVLLVEREGRQASIHYVITDKLINQILINQEATGRLAKWGIKLEAYGIKYAPRSMIKGQVFADFLVDTMAEDSPTQVKTKEPNKILVEGESMEEQEVMETKAPKNLRTEEDIWKLYTDGASNEHGLGVGLRIAAKMKVEKMHTFVDSKLVANQVEGSYEAKGEKTKKYKEKSLEMIRCFNDFQINHIPREENRKANTLSKLAAVQCEGLTKGVLIEELNERSVDMVEVNAVRKQQELG